MAADSDFTLEKVLAILQTFTETGEIPTDIEPGYLLWQILRSWQQYGGKVVKKKKIGRPGRGIRPVIGRYNGTKFPRVGDFPAKTSGRSPFREKDLETFLRLLFATWHGDELVSENQLSLMVGRENALAQTLCRGGRVFIQKEKDWLGPSTVAPKKVLRTIITNPSEERVIQMARELRDGANEIELGLEDPQAGEMRARFVVVGLLIRAGTPVVEIGLTPLDNPVLRCTALVNPQTNQGIVVYNHPLGDSTGGERMDIYRKNLA